MISDTKAPAKDDDLSGASDFLERAKKNLDALEAVRLTKLKAYNFRKKTGAALGAILSPVTGYVDWLLLSGCHGDDCIAGLTIIVGALIYAWVIVPKLQYTRSYKKKILPEIAKLFGDFVYKIEGKIPINQMRPSKIVPSHDRYKSEDYFEGKYKGAKIRFSEIHLEDERRDKDGDRYYVTVFKGLAILINMPKNKFSGHTIVVKDSASVFEWFKEKGTGLDRANLVDPEFEKQYDVYTDDQVEARYLIDPIMIERFKELASIYKSKAITAAYYKEKLLVLIPSKHNFFEPASIHTKATDPDSVLSMKKEVEQTLALVDLLELYERDEINKN